MQVPILRIIFSWRMLVTFFLGISSGIPLLVTGSTLQAWMTDEKVNLAVIGMFSLVGLPYTVKFLWSPFLDRYVPPFHKAGSILQIEPDILTVLQGLNLCCKT